MSFAGKFLTKQLRSIIRAGIPVASSITGTTDDIRVLEYDGDHYIVKAKGTDVPANATAGYAKGCIFIDTDISTGNTGIYENVGTTASCNFDQIGSNTTIADSGVDTDQIAADAITTAKIADDAVTTDQVADDAIDTDQIADDAVTQAKINAGAVDTTELAADAVTAAKIGDDEISAEHLDSGIFSSHVIKFADEVTWTGSGSSIATTVSGALTSDIVFGSIQSAPTQDASLKSIAVTENTVTTTLSAANTSNDAVIAYQIIRAVV